MEGDVVCVEGDVWMCEGGVCDGKNLVICTQCHAHDVM